MMIALWLYLGGALGTLSYAWSQRLQMCVEREWWVDILQAVSWPIHLPILFIHG
jgi:hypothetical protein